MENTIDWARIDRVLALIEQDESKLDMGTWADRNACGTSMCFAGWIVYENGDPFLWYRHRNGRRESADSVLVDGVPVAIQERARRLLGITHNQAFDIFISSARTLADLRHSISEVLGEPVV